MKLRIEFYNESEKEQLLSVLSANFEVLDISKPYPNRLPSKASRVYVELGLAKTEIIDAELVNENKFIN